MAHLYIARVEALAHVLAEEVFDNYGDYQEAGYGWNRGTMHAWLEECGRDDDNANDNDNPADAAAFLDDVVERAVEICEECLSCLP
jgi:hypothetical protein